MIRNNENTDNNGCNLCPRMCNVNRHTGTGYCLMTDRLKVARAALHMWPCISGERGSGAVFFSGCTLRCVFCQNYKIAAAKVGKYITVDELADIMLRLQNNQANNINLVTPTHYAGQIAEALIKAKNYPETAKAALREMVRQTGTPDMYGDDDTLVRDGYVESGIMKKGVIVRHLILPGYTKESRNVIKYLYDTYKNDIYISIMNQYTPLEHVKPYKELCRKVTKKEYDKVVDYAIDIGVTNAFIQEGGTAKESFIPEFDFTGL